MRLVSRYFRIRTLCAHYASIFSTPCPVNAGVPESSKLVPWHLKLLSPIIASAPCTLLAIYEDDITLMSCYKDYLIMYEHLQQHIRKLESFFNTWRIKIYPTKSQAVIFSRNRSTPTPTLP